MPTSASHFIMIKTSTAVFAETEKSETAKSCIYYGPGMPDFDAQQQRFEIREHLMYRQPNHNFHH